MTGQHLLKIAESFCGPDARRAVFEPLVADWQREWHESRGARKYRVAVSGAGAFVWSAGRCLDLTHTVRSRPQTGFTGLLLLFASAALIVSLQPIQSQWFGAGVRFSWLELQVFHLYSIPNVFAFGLAFALLPALLVASAAGWRRSKLFAAAAIAVCLVAVLDGWAAPAAREAYQRRIVAEFPQFDRFRGPLYNPTTSSLIALARHPDPRLAQGARRQLQQRGRLLAMAVCFALLGCALGRVRARPRVRPRFAAIGAWWAVGWLFYRWLDHWGLFFVMAMGWPRGLSPWVAPAVFVMLSLGALFAATAHLTGGPRAASKASGPP